MSTFTQHKKTGTVSNSMTRLLPNLITKQPKINVPTIPNRELMLKKVTNLRLRFLLLFVVFFFYLPIHEI